MASSKSELQVITFAKNLCSYIMTVTLKSPKQFRFSLIGRMQNYAVDVIEELYYANEIYISPNDVQGWNQRLARQRKALCILKLLSYVAQLSVEQGAIQPKQYEQISMQVMNVQNLLGAWMNGDARRMQSRVPKTTTG